MRTVLSVLTLIGVLAAAPAFAITGFVVDARTRAPIANAEVTVLGERGSVRTGSDGGFEWALPEMLHVVFVIILPDGRVARPIHMTAPDGAGTVTLLVEPAVAQTVDVSGTAPGIDVSAGASSSLVTAADINLRHPASLGQILEITPGVGLISEGQSATPALRGLARGRTTILVDGSRASSERRAGPNASFLDPSTVDRIEVARGPASVAYGSDAMGGVIAVRTRRPDFSRGVRARLAGTIGGGVPEARGDLEVSAGYGTGGLLFGLRAREFDSYESPRGSVPNSGWRDHGLRMRWEHGSRFALWSVGWQGDRARDVGRPRSDSDVVRVTTPLEEAYRLTVSYERQSLGAFRRVRVDALVGSLRQRTDQDRLATPIRARTLEQADVSSREGQVRATADRILGSARIQMGADVDVRHGLEAMDTVRSYSLAGGLVSSEATASIERAHRTNAGAFAQAQLQPARRIRLSGGLRTDVVRSVNRGGYFGERHATHSAAAGSGALTIVPAAPVTVTAQVSRGFRAPTLSDRFYRGPVGRGFVEGNPELAPETSLQVDVVGRYESRSVGFSGAYYEYKISDLIERYQLDATSFTFRNRGAARLRGAELEARAIVTRRLAVSLTAQVSRGRDATDGAPIDDVAPRSVSVVARHHLDRVSSYIRVAAIAPHDAAGPSEVPTPGYSTVDTGAAARLSRRVQIVVVGRNLTDQVFYSSAGPRWVYAPGRHGSASVVLTF